MIKSIIFDLDNTICDFSGAEEVAKLKLSSLVFSLSVNPDKYWLIFDALNSKLFSKYTAGEIKLIEYQTKRFYDPFINLGLPLNAVKKHISLMNEIYMNTCNKEIHFFNDAVPALLNISKKGIHTCILTNGPSNGQRSKINSLFLEDIIDDIFISSEIGVSKPNLSAFAYVHKKLAIPREEILMVGDSAYYDYFPAKKYGFKAVLLDREGKVNHADRISSLRDLENIIH
ncbi:HAD family hydrolase [Lactococcus lactis]|uniref:HAD family hydrolase n=1 Tax=Lactococcus lactis TaxID=1358 RepID=UPI001913E94F|nr:HAD family hydrolase [Lactococcus lactis]MBK5077548.1 HAD family hydrolase [Lactococcus lactis]WDA67262.1 HAD family hydrolase [Lactococcus lactis]